MLARKAELLPMQIPIADAQRSNSGQDNVMHPRHTLKSANSSQRMQAQYCHSVKLRCLTGKSVSKAARIVTDQFSEMMSEILFVLWSGSREKTPSCPSPCKGRMKVTAKPNAERRATGRRIR
jgi:hypothetical protein